MDKLTDGAEIVAGCFRIRPEQRGQLCECRLHLDCDRRKIQRCIFQASWANAASAPMASCLNLLTRTRTARSSEPLLLALRLKPLLTRRCRYAWGVMGWQPSAWPLLNDQDPHTGYMMQVRCASRHACCVSLHPGGAESRAPGRLRPFRLSLL